MRTRPAFVLLLLLSCGSLARAAALPRSTPEAQGVESTALLEFVAEAERSIDALHSVMVLRKGHVIAEGWWAPYAAEETHTMFSLSKSFTSTAVGLAIAEGKLTVDDPVLQFFPDEAPAKPSANLRAMRVRDLLTMSAGHHTEDIQGFPYRGDENVVKKFLALPVTHKPGTSFVYNSPASYMLSAIVQKVTGQTVLDYLRPRLFEPLGIERPTWEASKQGVSMGGFGLSVRTEDIAKFGQLYLQRGRWNGKQLVPESWVETATTRWMSNGSNPASDWEQGYGFQFWRCRYGAIRGDGANGQFCVILPELDAVVAITAGTRNLQNVLNVVWAQLLPTLQAAKSGARPANAAAHAALREKLAGLSLKRPQAVAAPAAMAREVAGRRYVFPQNAVGLDAIALGATSGATQETEVSVKWDGTDLIARVSADRWVTVEHSEREKAVAWSGAWTAADTFTLESALFRTSSRLRLVMTFAADGESVSIELTPNVGAGETTIVGRREI